MKLTKKMMVAGAGLVAAVGIGSAAFAYFTANGSGDGSGSVATTVNGVTLIGTIPDGQIYPGKDLPVIVQYTSDNQVPITLGAISVTDIVVTKPVPGGDPVVLTNCAITAVAETSTGHVFAPAALPTIVATPGLALTMANGGTNQTDCLNANISFKLTAASPA